MAVINLSKEEIDEKGDINDRKKQTIENQMVTNLNRFWNQMASDWAVVYAATGDNIDVENYRKKLEGILIEAYDKTIQWFRNDFKRSLELSLDNAETNEDKAHYEALLLLRSKIEPAFILWISQYIKNMPPKQATFILDTTRDIITKRINSTIEAGLKAGEGFLSTQEIAKRTKKPLIDENRNRSKNIAVYEVGSASGDSQLEEGSLFENELNTTPIAAVLEKVWINSFLPNVRPAHSAVNGQRRLLNQLFTVMGELLMRPRDRSHGASSKNVEGCRCDIIVT